MAGQAMTAAERAFLQRLDPDDAVAGGRNLPARLRDSWQQARDAWGDLGVSEQSFAAMLALWLPSDGTPAERLAGADSREAYIVAAVLAGRPGAQAQFEQSYFGRAIDGLRRMSLGPAEIDDVMQIVRVKLLVGGSDGRCKLEDYAGKGDLRALIRVVATRTAIDLRRSDKRMVLGGDDELADLPAAESDPRLAAVRRQCYQQFAPAFSAALSRLKKRERNLLRLHVIDGVTLGALARSYGVHKTTVVRWLVKARESLLEQVCNELASRSDIDKDGVADLARAIRSQVELSLSRLLQSSASA